MNKIDAIKLTNAWKLYYSYHKSKKTGVVTPSGLPMSLSVEPTTACNLKCPECPSGLRSFSRPTGNMDASVLGSITDQVKEHLIYLNFYFQGEPFIHRSLLDMVHVASKAGIITSTSTNGHFLNRRTCDDIVESGLDRLIISIDGADQSTYEQYRKEGNLEKVLDGTSEIINAKKRSRGEGPEVIWQFLVVRPNEHQVGEIKAMGKKLGVDRVVLKTAQIYDFEDGNDLIPTIGRYSRYRKNGDGRYHLKNPLNNQCWKMWHSCVITWDGNVVPCCFDKDAHHVMGNVMQDDLKDIWNSESYNRFRSAILTSRKSVDICKNCSEGTRVWA